MGKRVFPKAAHGLRGERPGESIFAKNHFASMTAIPRDVQFQIDDLMMRRVAGNVYECPSTKDFWRVEGGKIKKLVGSGDVEQGESIPAAPDDRPAAFLAHILDDLEF
jgi:hypothetical protein